MQQRSQSKGSMASPAVVLQPIVDLADGTVWAHEALCRVPHSPFRYLVAGGGHSLPDEIAVVLEARMLRAAMAARERLPEDQIISVNVSPAALVTDEVQLMLLDGGPLDGVMIELTEHREPEPIDEVTCVVEAVRDLGAAIALDDVGGGRGALRYARALRPDVIKLDGDVVRHVDTEPMQRVMVDSAMAVARDLEIPVVAEGIETPHELDLLLRMGITLGQGFLLARPAPQPGDVRPHVRRWLSARAGRLAARSAVARGPHIAAAS